MRVYHNKICSHKRQTCSLTIREGISPKQIPANLLKLFPHYTWGYIQKMLNHLTETGVPSLYVRVYRGQNALFFLSSSSLTIREGISTGKKTLYRAYVFPHYTWGYIARQEDKKAMAAGSLTIREGISVVFCTRFKSWFCSLTIREGISKVKEEVARNGRFPHYTWGYIDRDTARRKQRSVPSLYVRVYRAIQGGTLPVVSSLTIREGISSVSPVSGCFS